MRKTVLLLLICTLFCLKVNSQKTDQSINGIQIGFLGIWLHNEMSLDLHWALRTEIGLSGEVFNAVHDAYFPILIPSLTIEPRWYYNSPKRISNSRNTFHNSGNFASINMRWYPNLFSISSQENIKIDAGFFIMPTWGIRRNLSYRLNYELGIGFGMDPFELFNNNEFAPLYNLHCRIGYKFGKNL